MGDLDLTKIFNGTLDLLNSNGKFSTNNNLLKAEFAGENRIDKYFFNIIKKENKTVEEIFEELNKKIEEKHKIYSRTETKNSEREAMKEIKRFYFEAVWYASQCNASELNVFLDYFNKFFEDNESIFSTGNIYIKREKVPYLIEIYRRMHSALNSITTGKDLCDFYSRINNDEELRKFIEFEGKELNNIIEDLYKYYEDFDDRYLFEEHYYLCKKIYDNAEKIEKKINNTVGDIEKDSWVFDYSFTDTCLKKIKEIITEEYKNITKAFPEISIVNEEGKEPRVIFEDNKRSIIMVCLKNSTNKDQIERHSIQNPINVQINEKAVELINEKCLYRLNREEKEEYINWEYRWVSVEINCEDIKNKEIKLKLTYNYYGDSEFDKIETAENCVSSKCIALDQEKLKTKYNNTKIIMKAFNGKDGINYNTIDNNESLKKALRNEIKNSREEDINIISDFFAGNGMWINISGPFRVGKSTVLQYFEETLEETGSRSVYVCEKYELQGNIDSDIEEIKKKLSDVIKKICEKYDIPDKPSDKLSLADYIKKIDEIIFKQNKKVVIQIDEMGVLYEVLVSAKSEENEDAFKKAEKKVREFIQILLTVRNCRNVFILSSGGEITNHIIKNYGVGNAFEKTGQITMGYLNYSKVKQLVDFILGYEEGIEKELSDEAVRNLYELSAGCPYFLITIIRMLWYGTTTMSGGSENGIKYSVICRDSIDKVKIKHKKEFSEKSADLFNSLYNPYSENSAEGHSPIFEGFDDVNESQAAFRKKILDYILYQNNKYNRYVTKNELIKYLNDESKNSKNKNSERSERIIKELFERKTLIHYHGDECIINVGLYYLMPIVK